MIFEHAIIVRSQPGKNADYGRALERVAFFPGVTAANVIGEEAGSVTIGYNGQECEGTSRKFSADLEADGLMADRRLWDAREEIDASIKSNVIALPRAGAHFQSKAKARIFDRRS